MAQSHTGNISPIDAAAIKPINLFFGINLAMVSSDINI